MRPCREDRGFVLASDESRSGCPGHRTSHGFSWSAPLLNAQRIFFADPPFCASGVLVGADHRRVNQSVFVVAILREMLENPLLYAALAPSHVPRVDDAEIAETLGHIAPWNTGPVAVQNRLYKQTIVFGRHAYRIFPARQQTLDPLPLIVSQTIPPHHSQTPPDACKQ